MHARETFVLMQTRYNYPGVTNNVLVEPDTYKDLAQHPKIVGCKM